MTLCQDKQLRGLMQLSFQPSKSTVGLFGFGQVPYIVRCFQLFWSFLGYARHVSNENERVRIGKVSSGMTGKEREKSCRVESSREQKQEVKKLLE